MTYNDKKEIILAIWNMKKIQEPISMIFKELIPPILINSGMVDGLFVELESVEDPEELERLLSAYSDSIYEMFNDEETMKRIYTNILTNLHGES